MVIFCLSQIWKKRTTNIGIAWPFLNIVITALERGADEKSQLFNKGTFSFGHCRRPEHKPPPIANWNCNFSCKKQDAKLKAICWNWSNSLWNTLWVFLCFLMEH